MNVAYNAGAVPGDDGSFELNTFTSLGMPGPDPTMMLSAVEPSICDDATLTPPRAEELNASKRANSVVKGGLPSFAFPE